MSIDPARIVSQPAVQQPSTPQGQVAPPAPMQGGVGAPGVFSQQPVGQPAYQQQPAPAPQAPVPPHPVADPRLGQLQNEVGQYRNILGELQRAASQNQQEQQLQNQLAMIQATYDSLPADQAGQYLKNQVMGLLGGVKMQSQQELQQERQRWEGLVRQAASGTQPTYLDYLTEQYQLSPDARKELAQIGDPDVMHRMAPIIKAHHDQLQQYQSQTQQNQVQLGRTQEVAALGQVGLTAFGGQSGTGDIQLEVSDDADERAIQIYDFLKRREQQARSGVVPAQPVVPSFPG
jgi:hypothetical protein